ncbi:hypothetical protein JCM5350_003858 [Sporobolomyces pararoseus]
MADQLPRGLRSRSRSPTPPQPVAFPQSHSSPRIVEEPPPPLQEPPKPPRRIRQGVHVLAVYILLWPHLSQTPPCQENRLIDTVSVAVTFLVGISLLGNSGSKLGTAISLVRIPVEATSLILLKDGLSQEDEVKLEEWLIGSGVVATLLSLLPFSLLLILPSTASTTSTFSIVAFLFSTILPLATICLYDVFLVLLSGTLILFDDPITTIAHLIPRNLVSMIASVHYGTSSSWLQLLTVYSGGTAVLMSLLWKNDEQNGGKEEDCEKALEPDPKPPRFPPKFVYLSLIPLLAFAFYSFIFEPALPLSTACSHLPPSLRPRFCPSRIEALPSETLDLVISYYNEDVANTRQNLDYMRHIPFVVERQSRVILYNKGEADEETLREGLGLASWDKVIKLPNIGREGATYLRHIIRNYNDTLAAISASSIPSNSFATSSVTIPSTSRLTFADHTFFLQPHLAWTGIAKPRLWTIPSDVGFASFGPLRLAIHGEDEGHGTYPFIKTIQNMFRGELSSPEGSVISWSAQFIASRRRIMANDYSSYRELDDMIEAPADHWLHQLWGPDNSGGPSNPTFGHSVERSWPIIFDCSDPRQIARECFDSDTAGIWHKYTLIISSSFNLSLDEAMSNPLTRPRSRSRSSSSSSSISASPPLSARNSSSSHSHQQQQQQQSTTRSPRRELYIYLALVLSATVANDQLTRLARRSRLVVLSFPLWSSITLFIVLCIFEARHNTYKRSRTTLRAMREAVAGEGQKGKKRRVWFTAASFVGSLLLKVSGFQRLDSLESEAIEIFVLPSLVLLYPSIARGPTTSSKEFHQSSLELGVAGVAFLVGVSLLGAQSSSRFGLTCILLQIPLEAACLAYLKEGVTLEEKEERIEWMMGGTIAAVSLSTLALILIYPLLHQSSFSLTFSPISWLMSLATVFVHNIYFVFLLFALHTFNSPIVPASHVIPRNTISLVVSLVGSGLSSLKGNKLQLFATYLGGTGALSIIFRHRQRCSHDEVGDVATDPSQTRPSPLLHLSFLSLAIFVLSSTFSTSTLSLHTASCTLLPTSLRSPYCPAIKPVPTVDIVVAYWNESLSYTRKDLDYVRRITFVNERDSRIVVYNKGEKDGETLRGALGLKSWDKVIKLENVGREGATYLQHILMNYNDTLRASSSTERIGLADYTFFLQYHLAWTGISKPRLWTIPSDVGYASFGPLRLSHCGNETGTEHHPLLATVYNIFREKLCPPEGILIAWSAQHVVSARRILSNDYSKYQILSRMIEAPEGEWIHQLRDPFGELGDPSNPAFGHVLERSWPTIFDCAENQTSFDDELLDVFQSESFPPYNATLGGSQDMYGMGGGTQRVVSGSTSAYSEAGSSPQGYASSTGYSTGATSFSALGGPSGSGHVGNGMEFDLNSVFAPSNDGDSPPFDFGNSLVCDFDTSGLQGIFSNPQQGFQPQLQQQSTQGLSPASTSNSPPNSFPLANNFQFQPQSNKNFPVYPSPYLAPTQVSPFAQNYPTPSRNPSFSSGASPSSLSPTSVPEQETVATKRRRVTLAETAGIVSHNSSSSIAPTAFAVKPDIYPSQGAATNAQPQAAQTTGSSRKQKAKSPVELIANAGISNASVYNPPTYQLLPKPVNIASSNATNGKGKRGASSMLPNPPLEDKSAAGGKGKKKNTERGHNAVEQKYRNSINNALATLRDTIPALRHLKPLPSMPVSKRKASQFTLPSSVANSAPEGLVDGVEAAKTLSKGVILNKAIEYIDYLRFARESHNEDLEMLKDMVRTMVGGGEQLVSEFEKKRDQREVERLKERENEREEGDGEDDGSGDGEGDEEEEEEKPAPKTKKPPVEAGSKKRAASSKRDRSSAHDKTKSIAASAIDDSAVTLSSQQISPPLTSEYRHIQALNAAHLENIAAQAQSQGYPQTHTFPPSPVSSDDHSVSPAALAGGAEAPQYQPYGVQPPRVLLASFMGLSFAGGVGYDWSSGAAAAAAEGAEVVGSAWTSRLARRSLVSNGQGSPLVDYVHPTLLSGLVALGIASILVSLLFVVYPLLRTPASPSSSRSDSRRSRSLSSLANSTATLSPSSTTCSTSRSNALAARKELLNLVNAPTSVSLPQSILKEAISWFLGSRLGLRWSSTTGRSPSEEDVEQAVAWVRIAEIETTVGYELSTLSRLYTFLRLSNLSRSPTWPQVTASTSLPAVTALLSTHLLSAGHVQWAETLWSSVSSQRKKNDSTISSESDTFVEVALDADFELVKLLLDPATAPERDEDDFASPRDTVPLLRIAEATCIDALQDVWNRIFTSIVDSTCPPQSAEAVPSMEKLRSLMRDGEMEETLNVVFKASVGGSEVRSLTLMTRAILDAFKETKTVQEDGQQAHVVARACMSALLTEAKQGGPFRRFASASPLCQLLLPTLPTDFVASFPPITESVNSVDHVAATTLSWLNLRRQNLHLLTDRSAYPSPPPSPTATPAPAFDKVDLKSHAQALSVRRLLAHDAFRSDVSSFSTTDDGAIDFEEAKDLLVDALTELARRVAGLGSRDDDSGVEL